ncbi:MAG TPA: hypothetical protein VI958_11500, partial [Acidobacteriota bacterium]
MNLKQSYIRTCVSTLPFLLLFLWFKFEWFFHIHLLALISWIAVSLTVLVLLWKFLRGRARFVLLGLWISVIGLVSVDCFQLISYGSFSQRHFVRKTEESVTEVQKRATVFVQSARAASLALEASIRKVQPPDPENFFIRLQEEFGDKDYRWGVYDSMGRLLCWSG